MARRRSREAAVPIPAPKPPTVSSAPWLRPALLVLAGALVYANSLPGIFTFDDGPGVVENTSIRSLTTSLSPPERGEPVAGRPLVNFSFAINYALDGLDAGGYHAANIALHLLCGLLLFGLIRRTWLLVRPGDHAAENVACACALVWLVHPLLTEAVNYVSQRTELLMSLCYLLTLYASCRGWLITAVVTCALGMASKETMATAPLLVVLYDRTFLYASFKDAVRGRGKFYTSLAGTWVMLAALIWSGPRWQTAGFSTGISVWTYLLNQSVMVVEYLRRVVWPALLVLDYGEPLALTLADVWPQAVLVVVLLIAAAVALVKRPALGFLGAAFFIILAPTSSVIPIATEVGAERRMYLPLAALVVLAVVFGRALWIRGRRDVAVMGMAVSTAAVCAALALVTVQRNTDYQDELGLWRTTLERWPHARAHRNYATLLKRAGYRDEVIDHLRQSLDGHPEGRYGLGFELYEQGRIDEAIDELRRFAREVPSDQSVVLARGMAGDALLSRGRYEEASVEYEAITRAHPMLSPAWTNLGVALAQAGHRDRARTALQRAVDLDPRHSSARRNLAALLMGDGAFADGVRHLEEAVRLDPRDAGAQELLAAAREQLARLRNRPIP